MSICPDHAVTLGSGPPDSVDPDPHCGLEANLLFLSDLEEKVSVLLVSLDALYPGPSVRKLLEEGLSRHLSPENIFIGASHTHSAPNLDTSKPMLGRVSSRHLESTVKKIISAAEELMTEELWTSVVPQLREFEYNGVVNRRKKVLAPRWDRGLRLTDTLMLPNVKRSPRVRSEIIELVGDDGPFAAIWIMPCHPRSVSNPSELSPDYIGEVRTQYRKSNEGNTRRLAFAFFQGASGDLRPPTARFRANSSLRNILVNIFRGREFSYFSPTDRELWLNTLVQHFIAATKRPSLILRPANGLPLLSVAREEHSLDSLFECKEPGRVFSIHGVRIGSFSLLGVSAEPSWEFRQQFMETIDGGANGLSLVGCIDDPFGYLVTASQFKDGGYESSGHMRLFGISAQSFEYPSAYIQHQLDEVRLRLSEVHES